MPFLPPNQQRQSTEGAAALKSLLDNKIKFYFINVFIVIVYLCNIYYAYFIILLLYYLFFNYFVFAVMVAAGRIAVVVRTLN